MNLHDKWATSDWRQLWADDNRAFVLVPNRVAGHYYDVLIDDGNEVKRLEFMPFSKAMDTWNSEINKYLAEA